ncbi:MAG: nucleoside deaminase [Bacteroidales bacterium]|jgi:guanine deaminase|nr:nucleoside deaminase [Bacteroidales bacterium]
MYKKEFMLEAIALSHKCLENGTGGPFGAVIVKDDKIVGRGSNLVTTHNDPTAHAEVVAIRDACQNLHTFQLTGCEIYTSCEPCPMCLGAIYWARPDRIYYAADKNDAADAGFDDSFIYKEIELSPNLRKIPASQHDKNNAIPVFDAWKLSESKTDY